MNRYFGHTKSAETRLKMSLTAYGRSHRAYELKTCDEPPADRQKKCLNCRKLFDTSQFVFRCKPCRQKATELF